MATDLIEPFRKRLAGLKKERQSFIPHYQELSGFILPRRGRFLSSDTNVGGKKNNSIVDSTATLAARTLSSGMMAGITSPARPWFRLGTPDPGLMERRAVKEWLEIFERLMRDVFNRSNLYNILPVIYEELGVFGTGAMNVVADHKDIIRAYPMTVGEYMLGLSKRLNVDTMYRQVRMTVAQVVAEYGLDNVSDTVKTQYQNSSYDQWVDVTIAIEPNHQRNPNLPGAKNMAFRSLHWEEEGDGRKFLRQSGFPMFPVMGPRWHVTSTDTYGRSPGMDALGDVKGLQLMVKRKAQGVEKMVNPPVNAPSSMKNKATSVLAGAINYIDTNQGQTGMTPVYEVKPQLEHLRLDIAENRQLIREAFYADLFLMLTQTDRREITAREIDERHEEKLLMLGPVLERLHDELLDPLISRVAGIMEERKMVPPPPREMAGQELKVEYISLLAQAQQMVGTGAIDRVIGFVGNLATISPEVVDKLDADQAVDEYAGMMGVPARVVVSDDEVAKKRAERQQQQNALQIAATAQQAVEGMEKLSNVDTTGGNMVSDFLGVGSA